MFICSTVFTQESLAITKNIKKHKDSSSYTYYFNFIVFGSLFADMEGKSNNAVGFGESIRLGARTKMFGAFVQVATDRWLESETRLKITPGVLNFAMGLDLFIFDDRVRMSVATGTSTLLFDTAFDKSGTTGIYCNLNFGTLRWKVGRSKRIVLEFTPLSVTIQMPVLKNPILKRLEYRTLFGVEVPF